MNKEMILILGVTASGKGRLAFNLAKQLNGEIISVDSMKLYRRMDIGTAKPPEEAREQIKYHLIDVVEPSELFDAARFIELAYKAIEAIKSRGKTVIAVGGTALYIKALLYGLFEGPGRDEEFRKHLRRRVKEEGLEGLHKELEMIDPQSAWRINPNDAKRIIRALEVHEITGVPISSMQKQFDAENALDDWTIIGLRRQRAVESKRINARVKKMVSDGLVDEVNSLLSEDKPLSRQAGCAIGYNEIIDYLNENITLEKAIELIRKKSRRLAKNQRTWFKKFKNVNWFDIEEDESDEIIFAKVLKFLDGTQNIKNP